MVIAFNSSGCPLMWRINYRCVESLNISVEVAKCGKYSQIHPVHSLFVSYKKWLVLPNNLFMVSFQLIRMSSYAKNKQQMCWVTQHQCRSRQMWKIFTNSPSTLTFCPLQRITILTTKQSIHGKFKLIRMSPLMQRTNYRCVESLNINAKCGKVFTYSPSTLTFCLLKQNDSWLNNLFMVSFQLIRMSSYAKNKQQMCWVTQHQCRSRQMWKIFTNSPSTLTFCQLQKND